MNTCTKSSYHSFNCLHWHKFYPFCAFSTLRIFPLSGSIAWSCPASCCLSLNRPLNLPQLYKFHSLPGFYLNSQLIFPEVNYSQDRSFFWSFLLHFLRHLLLFCEQNRFLADYFCNVSGFCSR